MNATLRLLVPGCIGLLCVITACDTPPRNNPAGGFGGTSGLQADGGGVGGSGGTAGIAGVGGASGVGGIAGVGGSGGAGIGGTGGSAGNSGGGGTGGSIPPWTPPTPPIRETPSCDGVAMSCGSRSTSNCTAGAGCSIEGDCTGLSYSCSSRRSSTLCIYQEGCVWSSANSRCSGSAWSCSTFSGSSSCIGQYGCNWDTRCGGSATSCSLLSSVSCELQPGCSLTSCDFDKRLCGSNCVDTDDDELHCGLCNYDCGYRGSCTGGLCECGAPAILCGGRCLDVLNDELNCGSCGNRCGPGYRCGNGACVDIDECASGICLDGRTCTNLAGSYTCGPCGIGYQASGNGCADINECLTNNGGCAPVAPCINTSGSHSCGACPSGYSGDGNSSCTDINECATNSGDCDPLTTCTNTTGSRTCSACPSGYSGTGATGCVDVNECATNNGGCDPRTTCTNTTGSRTCGACPSGYTGNGVTGCIDVNECTSGSATCPANSTCANTTGSYTCPCVTGYVASGNVCVDRNECIEGTPCDPSAACSNVVGTFACACNAGFTGNGVSCTDVNECALNTDNCHANGTCANTVGAFTCTCNSGYVGDGVTCADIDQCTTNNGGCDELSLCANNLGTAPPTCGPCPSTHAGTGYSGCIPALTSLVVTNGTATPAFARDTTTYAVAVPLSYDALGVTATTPAGATLTINGTSVASGVTWWSPTLALGASTITIVVAQVGHPSRTYRLNVTRRPEQVVYAKATVSANGSFYGVTSALSGNTLVVGAPGALGGRVFVYVLSGGTWTLQELLTPSNAETGDFFGVAVAIDGDTLVVGASGEDGASAGVNGDQTSNAVFGAGAAYVFARSGSSWSQTAYLKPSIPLGGDAFGSSVSISGDRIAVGSPLVEWMPNFYIGAVDTFVQVSGTWIAEPRLVTNATNPGRFGCAVALSGASTLFVGAMREPGSGDDDGAVHRFDHDGSSWVRTDVLVPAYPATSQIQSVEFGASLAVSGNTLVVGTPKDHNSNSGINPPYAYTATGSGAVYVFTIDANSTTQQAYIKATLGSDSFGNTVSLAGDLLVVGARTDSSNATGIGGDPSNSTASGAGAAYLFIRNGSNWTQRYYMKASNTGAGDGFGYSVATNGAAIAIGARTEASNATGFNGDQTNNAATSNGAVYVFR